MHQYKIQTQLCPVCKTFLGTRDFSVFFIALCPECDIYYSWDRYEDKAVPHFKEKDKGCGCGRCGR